MSSGSVGLVGRTWAGGGTETGTSFAAEGGNIAAGGGRTGGTTFAGTVG